MATDFNKNTIQSTGGFVPVSTNTPLDRRTRVATEADIMNIPNPFVGMIVFVEDVQKRFEIIKLKSKKSGFATIVDALVDEYIEFDPIKHMGYASEQFVVDQIDAIEFPEGYDDAELRALIDEKADRADIPDVEGLASEEFVAEQIAAIELPEEYDDTELKARLDALEAIDHEEFLKEHQAIDHLAVKEEVDAALELKADKADLEGLANEQFVNDRIAEVIGEAPETLDTLKEIADAMEAHEDVYEAYVETVKTALDTKADAEAVEERFAVLEAIDHKVFLTEHQDISHLAVKADVDAAMAAHEEEAQVKFEEVEAKHAEDIAVIEERVEVLETINLETKPYIDKNGMLVLCGCPAIARGVGDEVHVTVRFFNDAEDKFVFTADEFAALRICMGYGAEGIGTKRNIVETTLEMYNIDRAFIIDGGSQITGEVGTVNIIAENVNYIDGIQGARAMNGGERNVVHNFNVRVKNVKLIDTLYGGGNGYSVVWNSNVIVDGDTTINWLTAGGSNGYTRKGHVVINDGHIKVCQGVNRGIVDKAEFVMNGGIVDNFYVAGEIDDSVTGVLYEGHVELNDGLIKNFSQGKNFDKAEGTIMDCVVEAGDISMLEVIVPEVEPEIDLSEYAKKAEVEAALEVKADKADIPVVDVDKAYVDEQIANIEHPQYDDSALVARVDALEAVDHDQFATKAELHAQPNFEYKVEVVDAAEEAKFEVSGEFPNLVITLKLPACYATPPDLTDIPMYLGFIPFDQAAYDAEVPGTMGFTTTEEIGPDMDMRVIQFGLDYGSLVAVEPEAIGRFKLSDYTPGHNGQEAASFMCVIIPKGAGLVAYIDNGVGEQLTFSSRDSDDGSTGFLYCQEKTLLNNLINGVEYELYGAYLADIGQFYLHVVEEQ